MKREDLTKKHDIYEKNINDWKFYSLAYKGGRDFVEAAIGGQNARESISNYKARIAEGINFNFAKAIVDIFNFYLTEKEPIRDLSALGLDSDKQFQMFKKDCDLYGSDFDIFMNESQKKASVTGTVGILVSKPETEAINLAEEIRNKVYPYCALYTMQHIHDWAYGVDKFSGRPILTYLKLEDRDERIQIWTPEKCETWEDGGLRRKPILLSSVENPIGEIPFLWLQNIKDFDCPYLGCSDIVDISWIVASIVRNLSSGEETIKYAGFPMLRKAMDEEGNDSKDTTGQRSIQEFDPEYGEAGKPDWLESKILEPIEAIMAWIDRKADEIYRIAHLSGVHGQRKSNNEVASGLALRYEFQQLTSVLGKKADNLSEAERRIIYYFCRWQNRDYFDERVFIKRQKNFSIDDLSLSLSNVITAMTNVMSKKFREKSQSVLVKQILPDLSDAEVKEIEEEIAASTILPKSTDLEKPDTKPPKTIKKKEDSTDES